MTIAEARKKIKQSLSGSYDENEIRNFTDLLFSHLLNYSKIELRLKGNEVISQQVEKKLDGMLQRLMAFEPVQYVVGKTVFYDLPFLVSPHVLIPRPETEELVDWVRKDNTGEKPQILDIGTGSGCIAVSLAKRLSLANVSGCDNDEKALETAMKNADLNEIQVSFFLFDLLKPGKIPERKYDVVVSNPPYVRESEKVLMHANILNYEPHRALFVPDDDPLVFYRAIADLGRELLLPTGTVYCEINENLPDETLRVFHERKYQAVEMRRDINGKPRMIKAIKN
jgi:release factor glutamine methyltransferase